jgi:beta-exotoxin I transport system permease protein
VSAPVFRLAVRLRLAQSASAAFGLIAVLIMVGALFPAVGDAIGKLDLPEGVADLLGGADYGTITGWYRGEISSVYGPLVAGGIAIVAASASTAGEEDDRILALILAHPVTRTSLVVAKAAAVAIGVVIVALATWVGLIAGVAVAGGGIGVGNLGAYALHLAFFGFSAGAVALAIGAATGRRGLATGGAAAFAVLGFLINGFAPLVDAIEWLKYVSPFYYYAENDPLSNGVDLVNLVVLGLFALAMTAIAMLGLERRDLRA